MTLTGYLPPICDTDPVTGQTLYLVDGGYMNNFPADVMKKQLRASLVIGVNVASDSNFAGIPFQRCFSAFATLFQRCFNAVLTLF